jgi:hypothetical protein
MIEIRRLGKSAPTPPRGAPWVLIEKRKDLFFTKAQTAGGRAIEPLSWRMGVDNARLAIKSAEQWADLLSTGAIYFRDEHEPASSR